jgi:hypothetical protein
MIDHFQLLQDLKDTLTSTLKLNIGLEVFRSNTFHRKINENSAINIQKITTQIDLMEQNIERLSPKKVFPLPSQRTNPICLTPAPEYLTQRNDDYLKRIIKISNSRLCSNRAGNYENRSKLITHITQKYDLSTTTESNSGLNQRNCNTARIFDSIHEKVDNSMKKTNYSSKKFSYSKTYRSLTRNNAYISSETTPKLISKHASEFLKMKYEKNIILSTKLKKKFRINENSDNGHK